MITVIDRNELITWQPLIKELVEQEKSRGDNLDAQKVMADLLIGGQTLVVISAEDGSTLLIMLVQDVIDRLRPAHLLYINNFYMPSKDAFLATDLTMAHKEFAELAQGYDKILFQTRNAALVRFLSGLGLAPQMEHMTYSLNARFAPGGD